MQHPCLQIKGSSSVLSICFYMLTNDCENDFKGVASFGFETASTVSTWYLCTCSAQHRSFCKWKMTCYSVSKWENFCRLLSTGLIIIMKK